MAVLGVDVGGTFTDAVLIADGDLRTAKVRTAQRQEESVLAAAPGPGTPLPALRAPSRASRADRGLLRRPGADGAGRRRRAARPWLPPRARRRGGCNLPAVLLPGSAPRARRRRGDLTSAALCSRRRFA